jgi:hypothetical protein
MEKVRIKVKVLGGLKHRVDFSKIKNWSSKFFEIIDPIEQISNIPNSVTEDKKAEAFYYSDIQLKEIIGDTSCNQLTVALINQRLTENYYERSIGDNCYVLTLYETADIVLGNDFQLHDFIIQELYYTAAVYYRTKGNVPLYDNALTHHDNQNCLFDFNDSKKDIGLSLGNARICDRCKVAFDPSFVPDNFIQNIEDELKKIKKRKFFLLRDFIKKNPKLSMLIAVLTTFLINLVSNFVFQFLHDLFNKKQ